MYPPVHLRFFCFPEHQILLIFKNAKYRFIVLYPYMNLLIIGGGIAGTTCAEEFRKLSPDSKITIISDENHPLYSRVLLPHYLLGKIPRERVFLKTEEWYAEQNINLVYNEAVKLDATKKIISAHDDKSFAYDKLLIAGGGKMNRLPISNDKRAHHLQTVEDADKLLSAINERAGGKTEAHIFGGSFIAIDFMKIFSHFNFEINIHIRGTKILSRCFDDDGSAFLLNQLEKNSVQIRTNDPCDTISETADIVGIGIGLKSEFSWARDAGLKVESGILTNEFLETNALDIYAAGDCAEYYDIAVGRQQSAANSRAKT